MQAAALSWSVLLRFHFFVQMGCIHELSWLFVALMTFSGPGLAVPISCNAFSNSTTTDISTAVTLQDHDLTVDITLTQPIVKLPQGDAQHCMLGFQTFFELQSRDQLMRETVASYEVGAVKTSLTPLKAPQDVRSQFPGLRYGEATTIVKYVFWDMRRHGRWQQLRYSVKFAGIRIAWGDVLLSSSSLKSSGARPSNISSS